MADVQAYVVKADGPEPVQLSPPPTGIHDLPAHLPYGVYTAFRTFHHNLYLGLDHHLARLQQSAQMLAWDYQIDQGRLRRALHEVCSAYPRPDARVRLDILSAPLQGSRELITLAPYTPVPPACYRDGVRVELAPRLRRDHPRVKEAHFVLARRPYPLGRPEAYEYLLLDEKGRLLEGSSSNFYAVFAGELWTAGEGVLEGVARRIILQLAGKLGIVVQREAPLLADTPHMAESFLSSSSRGIVPIVNIAGQTIGPGIPGPVTRRLMAAYDAYVARSLRPAVP